MRQTLIASVTILLTVANTSAQARRSHSYTTVFFGSVAQQKPQAKLSGRVIDARTGEPIAQVKVVASGTDQSTTTDDNGAFTLDNLVAGPVDLYITTITFGLVKMSIRL